MPKVSIVLPTYNGYKYINEAIESVIKQTYVDWELIIVNDCSTDDTFNVIEDYAKKEKRIRIINNEKNKKLPESLNIGFRNARGEYLTWTSDDNIYLPEAIGTMVEYLDSNKASIMVCTAMNMIDCDGNFVEKHCTYSYERMLYNDCVGASFMYRRSVLKDVGEYDGERFLVEDYDYWLRILFFYGKIDFIDKVLYLYRIHERSLTGTRKKEIYMQLLELRKRYIKYIIAGLKDRRDMLVQIYYEMKFAGVLTREIQEKFYDIIPEIKRHSQDNKSKKLVIYGAGCYGKKAYEKYKGRIKYFADQNQKLVGTRLRGVDIISLDSLRLYKKECEIMIAASPQNIYSFMQTLKKLKIEDYLIFEP